MPPLLPPNPPATPNAAYVSVVYASFVFSKMPQTRRLQTTDDTISFDKASFATVLSSFSGVPSERITVSVAQTDQNIHVEARFVGMQQPQTVVSRLEGMTASERNSLLTPAMQTAGMAITIVSVSKPKTILVYPPSPPPPQPREPAPVAAMASLEADNESMLVVERLVDLADAPLLASFAATLILPIVWVLWLYRRRREWDGVSEEDQLRLAERKATACGHTPDGPLRKARTHFELRKRKCSRHDARDACDHGEQAVNGPWLSDSPEPLSRAADTNSSSGTTEDDGLSTSDDTSHVLAQLPKEDRALQSAAVIVQCPASTCNRAMHSVHQEGSSLSTAKGSQKVQMAGLIWPQREYELEPFDTFDRPQTASCDHQDLVYVENYLAQQAKGSQSSADEQQDNLNSASRSEAVLARARARARLKDGTSIQRDTQPDIHTVPLQQQWLAAAMGAVNAQEERDGQSVNVQLDWLSVAITEMGSFEDDDSPKPSSHRRVSDEAAHPGGLSFHEGDPAQLEAHVERLAASGLTYSILGNKYGSV